MTKISIIIPVYNVEKYLRQCLDSVVNQTLKDIEIICVNDCSPDNSLTILQEYATKDSRIKLIDLEENGGLGNARNVGMKHATGEYLMFLDSDDWLEEYACEFAYSRIKYNDNDFLFFNYYFAKEVNRKLKRWCNYNKFQKLLQLENTNHINFADLNSPFNCSAESWFKIYKRSFIEENNIEFLAGHNFEDQTFYAKVLCLAKDISVLNIPLLNYRQRTTSITANCVNWKDLLFAREKVLEAIPPNASRIAKDSIILNSINSMLYWFKTYGNMDESIKKDFYVGMREIMLKYNKLQLLRIRGHYEFQLVLDILKSKTYKQFLINRRLSHILTYRTMLKNLIQNIFSVTNSKNRKHKVIKFLGLTLKIKRKSPLKKFYKLPVVKNRIVFDNFNGSDFGCNPKYITEELIRQKLPYELIWLVKDVDINNVPEGVKTVHLYSKEADKYISSAKVIVANCRRNYFINRGFVKKDNQCYIQTWHGCLAFKKIEKDIEHNKSYKKYLKAAKIDSKYMNYLVSPSRFDTEILKNCFYYNGEFLEVGYPRNDLFFYNSEMKNKIKNKVYDILNIPEDKKVILYCPTFRDSKSLDVYKIDTNKLINVLKEKYNEDFVLVTRLHPNIYYKSNEMLNLFPKAINGTNYEDIQELLLAADILITDYSSCIFDFCIALKPAFVFAVDIHDYESERGFYLDIHKMPFPIAETEDELFNNILNFDDKKYVSQLSAFLKERKSFDDGNASKRIVEIIKKEVGKY